MKFRKIFLSLLSVMSFLIVVSSIGALVIFLFSHGFSAINKNLFFGNTPAWEAIFAIRPVWNAFSIGSNYASCDRAGHFLRCLSCVLCVSG